ncbi:SprT family zinc-dependent metalloprotease [Rudaea sp.]|uniref:M48 family metallopeptidase n=1 Tax=Rudaea sp. TaxID=2136325 RepID=UPI003220313F
MNIETCRLSVGGVAVDVVRKDIKNLHLGVYPPSGHVRVAAPLAVSDETIRLAIVDKLGWIKRQRERFRAQPRQSAREMIGRETHYFLGRKLQLRVHEHDAPPQVAIRGVATLDLFVRPGASVDQRRAVLANWYRQQLRALVPPLLDKWQTVLDVDTAAWGIKKMKTKWGSCNSSARRIWLNLELAKKPARCLEYVVVHELLHLRHPHHDQRFIARLDQHLPAWRRIKDELNREPLADE